MCCSLHVPHGPVWLRTCAVNDSERTAKRVDVDQSINHNVRDTRQTGLVTAEPLLMPGYRCFFLNGDGHISGAEEFTSENDLAAISEGKRLFTAHGDRYSDAEVWRGPRRLWTSARNPTGLTVPD